ncbi:Fic family protein [uncultured Bdellovibrio sp.]|uniref:Fic family protein n=1 Tax=Bdellovibrio sp. HCB-162 TaxID=3394234 RepID=UPI0025E0D6BF|nr:Fic family protein [uncultured Bdellovibrio sp.]
MSDFVERLSRKPTDSESTEIQKQLNILEELRQKTEDLPADKWQEGLLRLAPFRLKSSGTLKKGDVESWQQANIYVAQKIQTDQLPTWEDITQINALLLGSSHGTLRDKRIFLGPIEACPLEDMERALGCFKEQILHFKQDSNPLIQAALCQYWLVSIHPFIDANGRTSVLLTDWILGAHGYLPMSFATKLDAIVASLTDGRASATPGNAILKLINNVQRSYRLILNEAP